MATNEEELSDLLRLAKDGDVDAQMCLGDYYFDNNLGNLGVHPDLSKAIHFYTLAALQGLTEAQHELWYIFCVAAAEPNFEEGLRWLQMAADKGYSVAQHDLASCYLNGTGVMVDTMAAVRLFRVAAEQGNADAQNSLGSCYHYGYGIPQDCGMALHWYRRAASQDNDAAICNLGRCYACGYGVVPNIIKAVQLYRKSAELGCGEALCRLAMLAEKGDGVPKDIVQAARLFQEGAAAHNGSETWDLDVFGDLAYLASTYTEITTWFRQKATEDDAGAQYCLALCYLHGHGVRQNSAQADAWLRRAAAHHHQARNLLRQLCGPQQWWRPWAHVQFSAACHETVWTTLLSAQRFTRKLPVEIWRDHVFPAWQRRSFLANNI